MKAKLFYHFPNTHIKNSEITLSKGILIILFFRYRPKKKNLYTRVFFASFAMQHSAVYCCLGAAAALHSSSSRRRRLLGSKAALTAASSSEGTLKPPVSAGQAHIWLEAARNHT